MNHFHIWCSLREGTAEREFADEAQELLADLHARELCEGFIISRRKFVFVPPDLGRFHITVEFASLPQMQRAFAFVEAQGTETPSLYERLTGAVRDLRTALYRDYPEPQRKPTAP